MDAILAESSMTKVALPLNTCIFVRICRLIAYVCNAQIYK